MVNITYCAFCVLCLCVVLWKLTYIFWKLPRELLSRFLISGQSVQDQNISRNLTPSNAEYVKLMFIMKKCACFVLSIFKLSVIPRKLQYYGHCVPCEHVNRACFFFVFFHATASSLYLRNVMEAFRRVRTSAHTSKSRKFSHCFTLHHKGNSQSYWNLCSDTWGKV